MSNSSVKDLLSMADHYYRSGNHKDAANIYNQILAQDPQNVESLFMLGVMSANIQQFDVAERLLISAAQKKSPFLPLARKVLGDVQRSMGKTDLAIASYIEAIKQKPDFLEAMGNLGSLYLSQNRLDESLSVNQKALGLNPDYYIALFNVAAIREIKQELPEAESAYLQLISLKPDLARAYAGVGRVQKKRGDYDSALKNLQKSIAMGPTADAYGHAAEICQDMDRKGEAIKYYRSALALDPRNTEYMNNLGSLYTAVTQFREAVELYQRILELQPENPVALSNLANVLKSCGRMDEAIIYNRQSLAVRPGHPATFTNLLLSMVYSSNIGAEEQYAAACEFGATIADPLYKYHDFQNTKDVGRRLKIGYVSPDFRKHSVNFFFEPLLRGHDRVNFEIFGYGNVEAKDDVTERLSQSFDHWRDIFQMSDEDAADLIRRDEIDILIDLAGHTGANRLLTFARKPAPIQATWLGYPATSGMKAMDYRIVDHYTAPTGMTDHLNTETLLRLPEVFCCFSLNGRDVRVIDHPPFEDNGYITFGCFNNFSKLSDPVLAAWAQILQAVPESRLLLEIEGLDQFRPELEQRLAGQGMPLDRVILEQRKPENQFVLYNKIDIALDPFPCNGGTTSLDTLWMGVPYVTIAGNSFVSRMGVSFLNNAGLPELVAESIDEYVDKASSLAMDRARLRDLRDGLRDRVEKSPLMDQSRFVRHMEDAYRQMWRQWCAET